MTVKTKHTAIFMGMMLGVSAMACADNHDPLEPYNRVMYSINDGIDRAVMVPVARGYQKVTPKPVQTGVSNVFDNLRDVVSFGSNVLRLDAEKASTDLVRVGINTTFGLGGLINIADAAQMPNNKNSLGDTFASWGWKNSNYFVYPLTGPSTVRDAVGDTVLRVYSVEGSLIESDGWGYAATALKAVDKRAQVLVYTDGLDMAAVDRYSYMRDMFMHMRAKQVGGHYSGEVIDDVDIDTLVIPNLVSPNNAAEDDSSALTPAVPAHNFEQAAQILVDDEQIVDVLANEALTEQSVDFLTHAPLAETEVNVADVAI